MYLCTDVLKDISQPENKSSGIVSLIEICLVAISAAALPYRSECLSSCFSDSNIKFSIDYFWNKINNKYVQIRE